MSDDTTIPTGWTDIKGIYYGFDAHCASTTYPNIHKTLRIALADTMENMDDYFTDDSRTEFINNDDLMTTLRASISNSIMEEATETTRPERINSIVNSLPIIYRHIVPMDGMNQTREIKIKNSTRLREAFESTRKHGNNVVSLILNINSLHFKKGQSFRPSNFDHIGNESNPVLNSSDEDEDEIKIEETTGTEEPTTTSAMIAMIKTLVESNNRFVESITNEKNIGSSLKQTNISLKNFNVESLPKDVKKRVYDRRNRSYMMPHTDMLPFATDMPDMLSDPFGKTMRTTISHFVVPNILITRDGYMFRAYTEKAIEKRFTHDTPEFDSNTRITPSSVRMWYKRFVKHGLSSGVYVHPYYCFRPSSNSDYGFTCGTDTECERYDLPSVFSPALDRWSLLIGTAIQNVFPKGSNKRNICNHNVTDGYAALRNLVISHHPSFHEHGPSMAIHPPLQSKRTDIFEHFEIYCDHLEMKAFTQNISTDLDEPDQMTNFILSCRFGDQILLQSRDERRSTSDVITQQWKFGQITSTLSRSLDTMVDKTKPPFPDTIKQPRVPDPSPTKAQYQSPSKYQSPRRHQRRDRSHSRTPRKTYSGPITTKISKADIHKVESMIPEVTHDDDRLKIAIYRLGINAVKQTGSFDVAQKCLVCQKTGHTFDECPVLNNHDLLKKLHISFCSMCRRMQRQSDEKDTQSIHGVAVSDVDSESQSSSSDDGDDQTTTTYYHDESDFEPDFH
jgi:hypothetical protein